MALGYRGNMLRKGALHIPHTHTLKQLKTFGKTSGATVFSQLYHKQLLNTLLPLILHCHRQAPLLSAQSIGSGHTLLFLWVGLGLEGKRRVATHTCELGLCTPIETLPVV